MKKFLSLLMTLCLLLPAFCLSEGESLEGDELLVEEIVEEATDESASDSEYTIGDEFDLTEEEQNRLEEYLQLDEDDNGTSFDPAELDLNPNLPSNVFNILLIGVDSHSADPLEIVGKGDSQIIVSINKETGSIKMTSILRDTLVDVPVPGKKKVYSTKITNSFKYGCNSMAKATAAEQTRAGAFRAMWTINKNFDMNIQDYVVVNFNGLSRIIDALGGIDIDMSAQEAKAVNAYLAQAYKKPSLYTYDPTYDRKTRKSTRQPLERVDGIQHCDGIQALTYARLRKIDNDFVRSDRQRHLLDLLLKKVMTDMDALKLMDLIGTATDYAVTNMNFETLFNLALSLYPHLSEIMGSSDALFEQLRIPEDDTWRYSTVEGTGSVVKLKNKKATTESIHSFIYGTYYPAK